MPRRWLFTDERIDDDALMAAMTGLPAGSAIVFRHYGLALRARRALFEQMRAVARRRRLWLILAGNARQARAWGADGWHGKTRPSTHSRGLIHTAPCHNRPELLVARRTGADVAFLSPVFSTRSHTGAPTLGPVRFGLARRGVDLPVVPLGGMTARQGQRLTALGGTGWAAIDALSERRSPSGNRTY
ncbi:thiamine phosphate synthase [Sphingobium subterraneum]|uniref:Thiamine-phosphate pyrophosphorylase n=1 Tax=Sphingobium subterraneum TaxID=627688 RepID=A0A841J8Q9_9SPHN|nr:thiamine phosphate synthase [Sphingobium subterraneum]MBB6124928.1 thiamine-phosphate pyrophosphorylase [Sphingobium subterraneum]